ncbi:trichothecene efflux pump [Lepidopterella palustris CBS 459.81]|uniref:Trichothecene efflux pump n=1 Tax=Lepidopterella palustris CBS 459.81 TaxID=1314670 RepID=A0A8E2E6E0_9PEZI|nr:trichothecene efflux pump [Lepidopterella palustris CBS 459.81]
MAEKDFPQMAEYQEPASDYELQAEKTNNTVSTGFDATDNPDFKFGFTKTVIFLGLVLGFFSDNLVIACVSSVITTVNADLGPSTSYVWIISAVYTTISITSPFVGRLGDIFGRKYLLVLGNLIGGIGCIVSATGNAISTLIVAAVLIGLGSSMDLLAWAAVGEIVPKKQRPVVVGMYEFAITPSAIFAAFIGLSLTQHTALGWRNIYWLCFALHGAAIPILMFFYHPLNQYVSEAGKSKWDQVKSLDYIGVGLFCIGLCLFLVGLSFGDTKYPWKSAGTLAPLLIGILFLAITGVYEYNTHSPYNIFPHSVMKEYRGFTVVCGVGFLSGIVYYSSLLLWPLQISTFYTTTATGVGLYSMAWGWGALLGAGVLGFILQRVDQARFILIGICAFMTIMSGTQAIVGIHTNAASCALLALTGSAVAAATVTINSIIQLSIPHQYLGVAMGLITTFRYVGGSIGSTIYEVILSNQLKDNLGKNVATALATAGVPLADIPAVAGAIATGNTTSPALADASPAALGAGILALKLTYVHAFKIIYLVSIAFGVLGTVCAAFTRNVGEFLTDKVDVRLDEAINLGLHEVHKGGHVLNADGTEITPRSHGAV